MRLQTDCGEEPADGGKTMPGIETLADLETWCKVWSSQETQTARPLLLFKRSPTCPISLQAEESFRAFAAALPQRAPLRICCVDVIAARAVSQRIAADTGVEHESPQALLIGPRQKVLWHASHYDVTAESLAEALAERG
jgi:bacillithiol system protein YtxJ